jgi:hypothetical protein
VYGGSWSILQQNTLLDVLHVVNAAALPMHTAQTIVWLFGSLEGTSLLDSHKINTSSLENYFVLFSTNFQYPYETGKFKYGQLIFTHIWRTEWQ